MPSEEDSAVDCRGLPRVNLARCSRCGTCVLVCSGGALTMGAEGPRLERADVCGGCALCEEICPDGAIDCEFEIVW